MFPFEDTASYLRICAAITAVGLCRISFGGAPGVIAVPILSFVLPPSRAAGVLLPIMIICDLILMRFYFKHGQWHLIKLLMPGTLIGILLGITTFALGPEEFLRKLLGAICVGFFVLRVLRGRILKAEQNFKPGGLNSFFFGAGAGYTSTLLHAGGPALAIYLLPQKLAPVVFVSTCVCYFMLVNLLKVPGYIAQHLITRETLLYGLWILPAMVTGSLIGVWINSRVPERVFMNVVYGFLLTAGIYFLWK